MRHLETGADLLKGNWLLLYDLGRYACRLKRSREAWQWLEKAFDLGDGNTVKLMALDDPELEPLWLDIAEI